MPTKRGNRSSRSSSRSSRSSRKSRAHRRRRVGGSHFYNASSEDDNINAMLKEAKLVDSDNRVIMHSFKEYLDANTRDAFKINGTPLTIHFFRENGGRLNTYGLYTTPESMVKKYQLKHKPIGDVLLGQFTVL
jgi:hypothetical protein